MGATLIISRQQKSDYIEAMGIRRWLPRVILPNAMPPIQFSVVASERFSEPVSAPNDVSENLETQSPAVPSHSPLPSVPKLEHPPRVNVSTHKSDQNSSEPNSIRFGLALYVVKDWLVCSSLTSDYQEQEASAVQLINNILNVLGVSELGLAHHHIISWPFFTNPNASQGVESAKQYVNGVIEHIVEEHKVSKMLVCGGVLAKLNKWQSIEGSEFELSRLIIPSVYKMLADPSEKAKAWQIIQNSTLLQPVSR